MNIREYLDNPMGKGDSSIPNRQSLILSLSAKYDTLIDNKEKEIQMKIYRNGIKGDYYFHLIIPSETKRKNTYDVVFEFRDPNKEHVKDLSLGNYEIRVFSNTPSFAYTFANVYDKEGLIIDFLKPKLGKKIFQLRPEVRNRYGIVNYDKYLYFGARYIIESKMLNKAFLDMRSHNDNNLRFRSNIRTLNDIMEEYKLAEQELRKTKKSSAKDSSSKIKSTTRTESNNSTLNRIKPIKGTDSDNRLKKKKPVKSIKPKRALRKK